MRNIVQIVLTVAVFFLAAGSGHAQSKPTVGIGGNSALGTKGIDELYDATIDKSTGKLNAKTQLYLDRVDAEVAKQCAIKKATGDPNTWIPFGSKCPE
jgi:hypothetical protein